MAKVNTDTAKGNGAEKVLAHLKEAFEAAKQFKVLLGELLPDSARSLLSKMTRPFTMDEMVLLTEVPFGAVMTQILVQTSPVMTQEDVLEELAEAHREALVRNAATRLATQRNSAVVVTPLVPSQLSFSCEFGPSVSVTEAAGHVMVGPGGLVSWFSEPVEVGNTKATHTTATCFACFPRRSLKKPKRAVSFSPQLSPVPALTLESYTMLSMTQLRVTFGDNAEIGHLPAPPSGILWIKKNSSGFAFALRSSSAACEARGPSPPEAALCVPSTWCTQGRM
eukprot:RCo002853